MAAETLPNIDSTVNALEKQFDADPQAPPNSTMLDILGIEMTAPDSNDLPLAPTATGFTDYVTNKGDGL
jgi:hypothetical protein